MECRVVRDPEELKCIGKAARGMKNTGVSLELED